MTKISCTGLILASLLAGCGNMPAREVMSTWYLARSTQESDIRGGALHVYLGLLNSGESTVPIAGIVVNPDVDKAAQGREYKLEDKTELTPGEVLFIQMDEPNGQSSDYWRCHLPVFVRIKMSLDGDQTLETKSTGQLPTSMTDVWQNCNGKVQERVAKPR